MKRTVVVMAIVSLLFVTGSANAEEKETELKFDTVKLWNLAGLPAYFFLENFLHESSHVLMAKSLGEEIDSFKPYPHHSKDGTFLMGGFISSAENVSARDTAFVAIAPYLTDAVLFISTDLLLSYQVIEPNSVGGLIIYSVGMLAPFVDLVYNSHGFGKQNDFVKFSEAAGVDRFATLMVTEGVILVAAYRLITQGFEVFSKKTESAKKSVVFSPLVGGNSAGFRASFKF